jgi:hypothetical protein
MGVSLRDSECRSSCSGDGRVATWFPPATKLARSADRDVLSPCVRWCVRQYRVILVAVLLEAAGLAMLAWVWRRAALARPEHRRVFLSSGVLYDRINQPATVQEPPTC